jgi:hypothetical protein
MDTETLRVILLLVQSHYNLWGRFPTVEQIQAELRVKADA